jgi:YD repeat-containing protein
MISYPDKTTGAASTANGYTETFTYNNVGETITKIDRNSTQHTYTYDVLGRLISDAASGKPTTVMTILELITPAGEYATSLVGDPGFEDAGVSYGNYDDTPYSSAWTFDRAWVVADGCTDPAIPAGFEGNEAIWFDSGGNVSQDIYLDAGYYAITLRVAGGYASVYVNGTGLGNGGEGDFSIVKFYFTIETAGTYPVYIETYYGNTTWIDDVVLWNVVLTDITEPVSLGTVCRPADLVGVQFAGPLGEGHDLRCRKQRRGGQ